MPHKLDRGAAIFIGITPGTLKKTKKGNFHIKQKGSKIGRKNKGSKDIPTISWLFFFIIILIHEFIYYKVIIHHHFSHTLFCEVALEICDVRRSLNVKDEWGQRGVT